MVSILQSYANIPSLFIITEQEWTLFVYYSLIIPSNLNPNFANYYLHQTPVQQLNLKPKFHILHLLFVAGHSLKQYSSLIIPNDNSNIFCIQFLCRVELCHGPGHQLPLLAKTECVYLATVLKSEHSNQDFNHELCTNNAHVCVSVAQLMWRFGTNLSELDTDCPRVHQHTCQRYNNI